MKQIQRQYWWVWLLHQTLSRTLVILVIFVVERKWTLDSNDLAPSLSIGDILSSHLNFLICEMSSWCLPYMEY